MVREGAYQPIVEWYKLASGKKGKTFPLAEASERGDLPRVKQLIENGSNVNEMCTSNQDTALHVAAREHHLDVVKHLIQKSARVNIVNRDGHTPLYLAVNAGHLEMTQCLIDHGAKVKYDIKSSKASKGCLDDRAYLHVAAKGGHLDVVKLLIENGTDVNAKLDSGATPLHMATHNSDVVAELIRNGANVNVPNNRGWTPLFEAVINGTPDTAILLIKNAADVRVVGRENETLLHVVAFCRSTFDGAPVLKFIYILIAAGCDPFEFSRSQDCTYALAERYNNRRHAQLLTDHLSSVRDFSSLRDSCRKTIRGQLMLVNTNNNLIALTKELPLPSAMKSYLLYDFMHAISHCDSI